MSTEYVALLLIVGYVQTAAELLRNGSSHGRFPSEHEVPLQIGSDFDYLMLTRIFPAAVCRADDDSVPDSCEIPPGTPMWSIHGLWPNFKNGSYPQFCDGNPMKFDEDLIKPIEQRLLKMWTNLYPSKTARSFWKHEWEKHGTCAQSHGNLSSELLYFSVTMVLDSMYSVSEALKGTKISPRVEPYHLEDIREALKQGLSRGKHVQLNCLTDKKTRQTMLGDVRMCLDKSFMPIDCPHGKQRQPSLYLLGHPPPLPSFKECPTSVIYLDDDTAGRSLKLLGVEHRELTFWINPLISVYSHFFSRQEALHEFCWGISLPFSTIVLFIYVRRGRDN